MSGAGGTPGGERSRAEQRAQRPGPLAWFARNAVAANVLMLVLLLGGTAMVAFGTIQQEVFPEVTLDAVLVHVPYPGASPEEVEQGVLLPVEEAVRGLDGVKEVRATATEGVGVVSVELLLDADTDRALSDVKSAVDRIPSLPEDTERPVIRLATSRRDAMQLVLYGDQSERALHGLAEEIRDELLQRDHVTQVELSGVRPLEISVEVPQHELREHGLTLGRIADAIRRSSLDLPGGEVETEGGEVLLRTKERREHGSEFADITLQSRPDGSEVKVRDVAEVRDGFREGEREATFDGQRAVLLDVYRVGNETPVQVSEAVHGYLRHKRARLPDTVDLAVLQDRFEEYESRVELLTKNAVLGLLLVLLTLGLFLEARLAFWVTLGIPISFLGALLFLPATDVSLNMISLFAFIITLGMVVDDAIVAGEAVYRHRQQGMGAIPAAVAGVREVAMPITFSIVTTCIAFAPLMFVAGVMGKFFRAVPIVVILVLLTSLLEALLVLPAHLAHSKPPRAHDGLFGWMHRRQQRFGGSLERFVAGSYTPFLRRALRWRYLTLATSLALLLSTVGIIAGGRIEWRFMPDIENDRVTASLRMPVGTSAAETRRMQQRIQTAARRALEELGGGSSEVTKGLFSELGHLRRRYGRPEAVKDEGAHLASVEVVLAPSGEREFTSAELAERWQHHVGRIPGARSLKLSHGFLPTGDTPIDFVLSHRDDAMLAAAVSDLAQELRSYAGVEEVEAGIERGKEQLDFTLSPVGRAFGLTEAELARQVRARFFGAEAVRQQRGRNEVRVYVRLPEEERRSLHGVDTLMVTTPEGTELPLREAAHVNRSRADTKITRARAKRTLRVTADVDRGVTSENEVVADVVGRVIPALEERYPGLTYELGGQQQQRAESMASLSSGFVFALVVMLGLLAVAFRSYMQPIIVMAAIPFGMVGAVVGHLLMGYSLSLVSAMGLVALAGVVVNSSLILVVATNELRSDGVPLVESVIRAGQRRFRPILLTSLTTFLGLCPMITETSIQARFLIPMAISLGFGVLFAMGITLVIVPVLYVIVDDARRGAGGIRRSMSREREGRTHGPHGRAKPQ